MNSESIEVSIKGQLVKVPALPIQGRSVVITGRLCRMAIIHDEEWLTGDTVPDAPAFVTALRAHRPRPDLFSFADAQPDTPVRHDYHVEWDNVAVVRTGSYATWWNGLSQDSRRNVRLAEKRGVKIERTTFDDRLVAGIKGVYDETPIRQGRRFWHYGKDLETVKRDNATYLERSAFISAYLGEELIGFIKMVFVGKTARIMQILSMNRHFDKRPANAMIAKAVEISSQEGMSYLAYCRYVYGKKKNSSITEFKRRNGFEELRFPRYYVPLSLKGRAALGCGLHLGVKNLLPEAVTERLLGLRSRVYEWLNSGKGATAATGEVAGGKQRPVATGTDRR